MTVLSLKFNHKIISRLFLFSLVISFTSCTPKTISEKLEGTWTNSERVGYYIKADGTFKHYIKEDDLTGISVDKVLVGAQNVPLKEVINKSGVWKVEDGYIIFTATNNNNPYDIDKYILEIEKKKFSIFDPQQGGIIEYKKK